MSAHLLAGPWLADFRSLVGSARHSLVLAAPFVTAWPLRVIDESLSHRPLDVLTLVTNFNPASLGNRSLDPSALQWFTTRRPETRIVHLPGLHAKAYVADGCRAIVTSANLTTSALRENIEAGVAVDGTVASRLGAWIDAHAAVGVVVSRPQLAELVKIAIDLVGSVDMQERLRNEDSRQRVAQALDSAAEHLRQLRAASGRSTNSIFAATVRLALASGSKTTPELHRVVQAIHPDLCDDGIDRVINGVRFGRRWKHMVRNAQQFLRLQGVIERSGTRWQLVHGPSTADINA